MNNQTQLTLLPGVRLTYLQTEKFKTDYVSVNFLRPLTEQDAPMGALLPSVLLRGTERYPDMSAMCAQLDTLYGAGIDGSSRKKGEVQIIGFYMDFIDDALSPDGSEVLNPAMDFLGQVLLHPLLENGLLKTDYLEGEKMNLINTIEAQINDKRAWASKRLVETMFEGEAYRISRLGTVEQVRAIDAPALTSYWRRMLAQSEMEIFFMGRAPLAQVEQSLRHTLTGLPRENLDAFGTQLCCKTEPLKERSEVMDVTQGKLVMGLRTPDIANTPQFPALVMCNTILGGTVTSKLFLNVREKMSLCYSVSSGLEKFKGVMIISAGVDSGKYTVARDAILRELEACRSGEITDGEIDAALKALVSSLRAAEDSPGRLDDHFLGQRLLGIDTAPADLIPQLQAVTRDDIAAAARRLWLDTIYFVKGETDDD